MRFKVANVTRYENNKIMTLTKVKLEFKSFNFVRDADFLIISNFRKTYNTIKSTNAPNQTLSMRDTKKHIDAVESLIDRFIY